jgi:hypothetical protein
MFKGFQTHFKSTIFSICNAKLDLASQVALDNQYAKHICPSIVQLSSLNWFISNFSTTHHGQENEMPYVSNLCLAHIHFSSKAMPARKLSPYHPLRLHGHQHMKFTISSQLVCHHDDPSIFTPSTSHLISTLTSIS